MLAPPRDSILAFGVAVYEVVVLIGAGHVPHPPLSVMVDDVRFVDASVFPILVGSENRRVAVHPPGAIPLEMSDRVRSPDMVRGAGIIDAFNPFTFSGVPTPDIRGAMPASFTIPAPACVAPGQWSQRAVLCASERPALRGKRGAWTERRTEELRRAVSFRLPGKAHPPSSVSVRYGRVEHFGAPGTRRRVERVENLRFFARRWTRRLAGAGLGHRNIISAPPSSRS